MNDKNSNNENVNAAASQINLEIHIATPSSHSIHPGLRDLIGKKVKIEGTKEGFCLESDENGTLTVAGMETTHVKETDEYREEWVSTIYLLPTGGVE